MATNYILVKAFASFNGLDLRSSDLVRDKSYASSISNCDFRSTAALTKRKGWQRKNEGNGVCGIGTYSELNTTTGQVSDNIVLLDETMRTRETGTLTINYTGSSITYYTIYADGETVMLDIFEDDTLTTSQDLGTGSEAIPVTISSVSTAINALTDFTATITGDSSVPAAFLDMSDRTEFSSTTDINFIYTSEVNCPTESPFALHFAERNTAYFQPASLVNTNGVLYISNGYTEMHKYDGQNLYRAGMPQGGDPTASTNGVGSVENSGLQYAIVYYQIDAKGNIVEGIMSNLSTEASVSAVSIDLTVPNIEADSGFNTNCAIVDGTQSSVTTITVDDGSAGAHTMQAGDTAYFYDNISAGYVTRSVESITASTISIAGDAVTVDDNAVISNNLLIDIYRNQAAGSTMYLLESIPNNSFASTQLYVDDQDDSVLGAEYIEPAKERGLPPIGKYSTLFRGQQIVSGFIDDVDAVAYADIDSPEYFPAGTNRFNVDTAVGDIVTGTKALNSVLYVFKNETVHTITGDLINDDFQVDILTTGGVGCTAHATIKEVNGQVYFLDNEGVFAITQGSDGVTEVSALIGSEFDYSNFNFKRATAAHWQNGEKYLLFMPVDNSQSGSLSASSDSKVYAYDTYRTGWLVWDNINALCGFTILNDSLFFASREWDSTASTEVQYLCEFKNTGTSVDFSDHHQAISAVYKTHWEALSEPSLFKKYLRLKLFSLDIEVTNFETQLFDVDVTIEHNFNNVPVFTHTFDFGNGSTGGWGENSWGTFPWGDARLTSIKTKLSPTKARSLRITFANDDINENFLLSGHELEVAAPYGVAIKE